MLCPHSRPRAGRTRARRKPNDDSTNYDADPRGTSTRPNANTSVAFRWRRWISLLGRTRVAPRRLPYPYVATQALDMIGRTFMIDVVMQVLDFVVLLAPAPGSPSAAAWMRTTPRQVGPPPAVSQPRRGTREALKRRLERHHRPRSPWGAPLPTIQLPRRRTWSSSTGALPERGLRCPLGARSPTGRIPGFGRRQTAANLDGEDHAPADGFLILVG
jgi:hypothetical protein